MHKRNNAESFCASAFPFLATCLHGAKILFIASSFCRQNSRFQALHGVSIAREYFGPDGLMVIDDTDPGNR